MMLGENSLPMDEGARIDDNLGYVETKSVGSWSGLHCDRCLWWDKTASVEPSPSGISEARGHEKGPPANRYSARDICHREINAAIRRNSWYQAGA